jgi:hypothetical protein
MVWTCPHWHVLTIASGKSRRSFDRSTCRKGGTPGTSPIHANALSHLAHAILPGITTWLSACAAWMSSLMMASASAAAILRRLFTVPILPG